MKNFSFCLNAKTTGCCDYNRHYVIQAVSMREAIRKAMDASEKDLHRIDPTPSGEELISIEIRCYPTSQAVVLEAR